jgi:hypothetical protein
MRDADRHAAIVEDQHVLRRGAAQLAISGWIDERTISSMSEQAAKLAPIETREIWSETLAKKARKISVVKAATSEIRARGG